MKSEKIIEINNKTASKLVIRITGLFEFRKPLFLIRDPKLLKKLAVKDFDYFMDHRVVIDESTDKMFGKSLISLKGQKWRG